MAIAAIAGRSPVVDEISERAPDLVSAGGSRTWSTCGRNFVVAVTELEAGDRLTEHDLPDEYVLLVQTDTVVGVEHEIRIHRLRDIPDEEGRLGRIFRTTSLMVNWFPVHEGPRDTERLSPHSHEDFEQMSVTLVGDHAHHLRVPWTARMSEWRDDEHVRVGSPSMTLIPPTVVHTTRAVGAGPHTLVDVFAPPREDFLAKGWVLNAGDYQNQEARA